MKTKPMKLIYIAGPYTAATMFEVEANIHESKRIALLLAKHKIPFFSPVCHTAHFEQYLGKDDPGYDYWIEVTSEMVRRCDAMFMAHGWTNSMGATAEYRLASELNLPVFDEVNDVLEWYKEEQETKPNG